MTTVTPKAFDPLTPGMDCDPYTQVQRTFCYFLQSLFEHREFEGTGLLWIGKEDGGPAEETEMLISSEKPRLEDLGKTPHITVIVGGSRWGQVGLDQMQSRKMAKDERVHTDLISSTVAYHCQAKEGTHARRMAWYASQYTTMFRREIMREGRLHQLGSDHQISAESGPSVFVGQLSNEELVSVVVTIPFYWQPQWLIRKSAPMLGSVSLNMKSRPPIPTESLTFRGRPVSSTSLLDLKEELTAPVQEQTVIVSEE